MHNQNESKGWTPHPEFALHLLHCEALTRHIMDLCCHCISHFIQTSFLFFLICLQTISRVTEKILVPVLSLSSSPLTKFPADAQLLTSHNGKNAGVSAGCEEEEEEAALTSCQTIRQGGKGGRVGVFICLVDTG